jgi:hypothetical protein
MEITRDLGFRYAQASTDNEIDPLFSTPDYMDEWFAEVKKCQDRIGVKVANFYTGYQTYRTVGFAHYNDGMVRHLRDDWVKSMLRRISLLGAKGLGFSMFAVPEEIMQSPDRYADMEKRLIGVLRELGDYAHENGGSQVSFEQMYVPYQPPFTIRQTVRYLEGCFAPEKHPVYVTIDTGHMIGQAKFLKPSRERVRKSFESGGPDLWLGGDKQYEDWNTYKRSGDYDRGADEILKGRELYPHLFAEPDDSNVYAWFERLGKYSPIVHMQQTDGIKASHASFTSGNNREGIITGEKLLNAIKKSYDSQGEILPPVGDIYLSFELFFSNMDTKYKIFEHLGDTLKYWRQFVPEDGITLDEAVSRIKTL